jgi:hypothetical protein
MGQRKGEERKGEERRGEERRGEERKGEERKGQGRNDSKERSAVGSDGMGVYQVVVNRDENQSSICTTQSNDTRS